MCIEGDQRKDAILQVADEKAHVRIPFEKGARDARPLGGTDFVQVDHPSA